ncbi:MAG TPA: hypothetical protein VFO55_14820 [Gemmatimonadaceae bacterium]|nr:hypothetical protein [Gemmatimonadaceae bacterium]
MRIALPLLIVVIAGACHSRPRPASEFPRRIGEYSFRINLTGREPVDGGFSIAADTVTLDADGQTCRRDFGLAGSRHIHVFSCFPPPGIDRFGITIDSEQPAFSTWTIIQNVRKTRTVCVRYATTARGTRVCAETRSEDYFEDVRIGGRLRVTRVDSIAP